MSDLYRNQALGLSSPIVGAFAISPSDTEDLSFVTRQIRVTGQGGTVAVVWSNGFQTIEPVAAGEVLDWRIVRILASGTTATGLRGYV